jgi:hypothetical protein
VLWWALHIVAVMLALVLLVVVVVVLVLVVVLSLCLLWVCVSVWSVCLCVCVSVCLCVCVSVCLCVCVSVCLFLPWRPMRRRHRRQLPVLDEQSHGVHVRKTTLRVLLELVSSKETNLKLETSSTQLGSSTSRHWIETLCSTCQC